MEQHIKKQMKKVRSALFERCEKNPWGDEMEFSITREESMEYEEFEAHLNKYWTHWKEQLECDESQWAGIMEYTIEWVISDDIVGPDEKPTRWKLYVEWLMDGFENPFYEDYS